MKLSLLRFPAAVGLAAALALSAGAQSPPPKDKMEGMKKDMMKKDAMGKEMGAMGKESASMSLAKGEFSGADGHKTSGSYEIAKIDGKHVLTTSQDMLVDADAPDVYVVLSNGPKVGKDNAVWLGKMASHSGVQTFTIPTDVKLDGMTTVVLWCKKYSATIGVAPFDPAGLRHGAMDKMDAMHRGGR